MNNYIIKKLNPDIDKIFSNKYSLSFNQSYNSYKYMKSLNKQYDKHCREVEDIYQDILYELGVLISDIKFNPSIFEIMYIFSYIYYNGYLSIDNKFEFNYPEKELIFKKAFSIFTGFGVCRNVGDMFSDLLEIFNIYSFGIITDRENFESESYELPKVYEDILKPQIQIDNTNTKNTYTGNHYEVLTYYNSWYLLDPSCICSYNITNKKNNYDTLKYLRFWSLLAMGEFNIKDTIKMYNLFKDKYLSIINQVEIEKTCYNLCDKNKSKIKQFHNDNLDKIEILSNVF